MKTRITRNAVALASLLALSPATFAEVKALNNEQLGESAVANTVMLNEDASAAETLQQLEEQQRLMPDGSVPLAPPNVQMYEPNTGPTPQDMINQIKDLIDTQPTLPPANFN